jgi:hypothetical protein
VTKLGVAATAVIVLVVGAQLVPVARTNPAIEADVAAPAEIDALLRRACYDCHSRETAWPWYSRVAPVSWLLVRDVEAGRRELDFSAWDAYDPAQRAKKLRESADEIAEGDMPPWYYRLVRGRHVDAAPSVLPRPTVPRRDRSGSAGPLPAASRPSSIRQTRCRMPTSSSSTGACATSA